MRIHSKSYGCASLMLALLASTFPSTVQAQYYSDAGLVVSRNPVTVPNVQLLPPDNFTLLTSDGVTAPVVSPTNHIVSPTAGLRVTNNTFIATGKASENGAAAGLAIAVTNVLCSLNGSAWASAQTTNNWANWTAVLNLIPGTNVLQACAVDGAGHVSTTNSVAFVGVFLTKLAVLTNGNGTLSPKYNGVPLAVGQPYSITATPAAGFAFTDWTEAPATVLTNGRTLTFFMASNLTLTASFVDTQKPNLTIISPTANQTVTTNNFVIRGTASDNVAVAVVWYQFDGGQWMIASGTNSWTAAVSLNPGTNIFRAYSEDTAGNVSPTSTVSFVYVDKASLALTITGQGTVSPNDNGVLLQVGQNYSLTAKPAAGFGFTNWSSLQITSYVAGPTRVYVTNATFLTNLPTLTFTMTPGLYLEAKFADIAPPTVAITAPTATSRISNSVYTVTGTAKDNVGVAAVYYQINSGGWQLASQIKGWTNWAAQNLTLASGTNTVQTYAVDTSSNQSATVTVSFVNLLATPAPGSVAGMLATITRADGAVVTVGFGTTNFSLNSSDPETSPGVGNYTYSKLNGYQGLVTFNETAPSLSAGTFPVLLTFSAVNTGTFSNEDNGGTGSVSLAPAANWAPSSLAGKKILVNENGGLATDSFGSTMLTFTDTAGESNVFPYVYQPYGPVGALISKGNPSEGINTTILSFLATNNGSIYFGSGGGDSGDSNPEYGAFVFPSASPVAPSSLAGLEASQIHGDGSVSTVAFGASTFSQQSSNTNHDHDVGAYSFEKINATNVLVKLTVAAPPTETNNSGSASLNFVAANFLLMTNGDNSITGLNLAPVATLVPGSLTRHTAYVTNTDGSTDVVTFTSGTSFSQVESNSENSGTSGGTYTFKAYGPVGAMLVLNFTSSSTPYSMVGDTGYVQLTYAQTGVGTFFGTFYDNAGDPPNISTGTFSVH